MVDGVTTYYVGNHYEVKNSVVTKYYFAGTTRLAVRTNGTLSFLLGDHIGSSSVTTDANGAKTASALYKAFGETRYTLGNLGTDYKFTGQREEASLGIYFFNARWMDPSLGRFLSPDSIVPTGSQGTQAWDRYGFVNNNPVRYTDPTGHSATQGDGGGGQSENKCMDSTAENYLAYGACTYPPKEVTQCSDFVQHACSFVKSYTTEELNKMKDHFEDLARTDEELVLLLGVVLYFKYGDAKEFLAKSGGAVGGIYGGDQILQIADARKEIAQFFSDAADDAHNNNGTLLIQFSKLDVEYQGHEPGYYLLRPGAEPVKVGMPFFQYWDVVSALLNGN